MALGCIYCALLALSARQHVDLCAWDSSRFATASMHVAIDSPGINLALTLAPLFGTNSGTKSKAPTSAPVCVNSIHRHQQRHHGIEQNPGRKIDGHISFIYIYIYIYIIRYCWCFCSSVHSSPLLSPPSVFARKTWAGADKHSTCVIINLSI